MRSSSKYKGQITQSGKHDYYDQNFFDEDGNVLIKREEPFVWRTLDPKRSQKGLLKHPSTYVGQYYPGPDVVEPHYVGHSNIDPRMNEFESEYQVPQRRKQTQKGMLWDDLHSSWEEHIHNYLTDEAQIPPSQPYQFEYKVHPSNFFGSRNSACRNKTTFNQPYINQNVVNQQTSVGPELATGYRDERFIFDLENDHYCDADELTVEQYLLASASSGEDARNIKEKPWLMENKEVPLNGVPLDVFGLPTDRGDDAEIKIKKDFINKNVPTTKYQESNAPKQASHKLANSTGKFLQYLLSSHHNTVSSAVISSAKVTDSGCALDEGTFHMNNHSLKQVQQNEWLAPQQFQWKGYMGFCEVPAMDCILLLNQMAVALGHDNSHAITFSHTFDSLCCHCFNITSLALLEQLIDISPIPVTNGNSHVLVPLWAEPPPPPRILASNYAQNDHHLTNSVSIIDNHKWTNAKHVKQDQYLKVSAEQNASEKGVKRMVKRSVSSRLQDHGSGVVVWSPNQDVASQLHSNARKNNLQHTTNKTSSSSKRLIKSASTSKSSKKTSKDNTSGSKTGRNPGVFPNAVQPRCVVLVVDSNNPCLDKTKLPKHYTVLQGKFMDPFACFDLIKHYLDNLESHERDNGILFIVHPWLDFFLKNLSAIFYESDNTNSQKKSIAVSATLSHKFSQLAFSDKDLMTQMLKILEDFSGQIQPMDLDMLTAQNKVPAANKKPLGRSEAIFTNSGITLLSQRLLHSAFQLRSTVLANTANCEVLFACCPIYLMSRANTIQYFIHQLKVPAWALPELIGQVMTALRVWNKFCRNQWQLGKIPYAEFNAGLELNPANKLTSVPQTSVITGTSCNDDKNLEFHQKCRSEAIEACAEKTDLETFVDWAKETGVFDRDEVLVASDAILHNTSSLESCEHNENSDGEETPQNKICQMLVKQSTSQITDGSLVEGIKKRIVNPNSTIPDDLINHAVDLATDHDSNKADNSSGCSDVPLLRAVDESTKSEVDGRSCCRESRLKQGKHEEHLSEMSSGEVGRADSDAVCIPGTAYYDYAARHADIGQSIADSVTSSADVTSRSAAATVSTDAVTSSADVTSSSAAATVSVDAVTSSLDAVTSSFDAVTSSADAVTSSADAVTSSADAVTSSADALTSSADAVTSSADAVTSSLDAVTSSLDAVTSSPDAVTSSPDAVTSSPAAATGKAAADDDVTTSSPDAVASSPDEGISSSNTVTSSSSPVTSSSNAVVSILSATKVEEVATVFSELPQKEVDLSGEVGDDASKTLQQCNVKLIEVLQSLSLECTGLYDKDVDVAVVEDPLISASIGYLSQHMAAEKSETGIAKKLLELSTDDCSVYDKSHLDFKLQDSVKAPSVDEKPDNKPKEDQGSAGKNSSAVKPAGVAQPFRLLSLFKVPPSETSTSLLKPASKSVTSLKTSDKVSYAETPKYTSESNLTAVKEDARKQVACAEAKKEQNVDSTSFCCRPLEMLSRQQDVFSKGSVQGRMERDKLVTRYTEVVVEDTNRAMDVLCSRAKIRVLPWDVFPGNEFKEGVLPSVLSKSIELKVLVEMQVDGDQKSTQYRCSLCDVHFGSLVAADVHCHAGSHVCKVQPTLIPNLREEDMALLTGKRTAPVVNGIRQDKKKLLMNAGIICLPHQNEPSSSGRWKCLICREVKMTDCSLRFHLHSRQHRKAVCQWLGVPQMLSFTHLFDKWDYAKSLLSHSPLDVVLLADNIHCRTLSNFSNVHRRVTVVTKADLLEGGRSVWEELLQEDLLSRWSGLKAEEADQGQSTRGGDKSVLWMLVAGSDLLSKEASKRTEQDQEHVIQQAFQSLVNFKSFLRLRVPSSHKVIVAPLMPLHLVSPDLPDTLQQHLLSRTNSVVAPETQLPALSKTYTDLSARVFTLHKTLAGHENIYYIPSSAVPSAVVEFPAGGVLGGVLYELTPWHVAMEGVVITAVGGMPAARPFVAYSKNRRNQAQQYKNTKT